MKVIDIILFFLLVYCLMSCSRKSSNQVEEKYESDSLKNIHPPIQTTENQELKTTFDTTTIDYFFQLINMKQPVPHWILRKYTNIDSIYFSNPNSNFQIKEESNLFDSIKIVILDHGDGVCSRSFLLTTLPSKKVIDQTMIALQCDRDYSNPNSTYSEYKILNDEIQIITHHLEGDLQNEKEIRSETKKLYILPNGKVEQRE